jgi:16S rRNA (adenine1518-N6/adenine1519-N6)-dimethyltransferase
MGSPRSAGDRRRRRWGQHFLVSRRAVEAVVQAIRPRPGDRFLEIGPGRGAITIPLLAAGTSLLAVEIDRKLAADLPGRAPNRERLVVVSADILRVDLDALVREHLSPPIPPRVVGNLPYAAASPILLRLLREGSRFADLTFMVQREVADRILSPPGGRGYGILTLLCAARAHSERLLDLPPSAFSPSPEVHSTLIRLRPLPAALISSEAEAIRFERTVKAAFSGRRKIVRNSLAGGLRLEPEEVDPHLREAGVDPRSRPEEIPLQRYLLLARSLPANPGSGGGVV